MLIKLSNGNKVCKPPKLEKSCKYFQTLMGTAATILYLLEMVLSNFRKLKCYWLRLKKEGKLTFFGLTQL